MIRVFSLRRWVCRGSPPPSSLLFFFLPATRALRCQLTIPLPVQVDVLSNEVHHEAGKADEYFVNKFTEMGFQEAAAR